jgi:MGT family glycosyltransferase
MQHDDHLACTQPAKVKRAFRTFAARASAELPDLRAAIDEHRPDLLLVDTMCWGALAAAETWGGPWAQFVPFPLPVPSPDAPPFGPGLKPATGPLGRLRDRLLRHLLSAPLERAVLPRLNAVRQGAGAVALGGLAENFSRAPLVLYFTAEPFDYPRRDWPSGVRMVGPCPWDPPAQPPPWLADNSRPLILVSTSSERQDDRRLVVTALEAFAGRDIDVVATLPAEDLAGLRLPPNAHVERFLPHSLLLGRAACAVTHGGAGVTQKAIAAGVPVCVVPFGRDQFEIARRVELAAAGTRLPASRLTPQRLRNKVGEAMAKRPGARRLAEAFAAAGGAGAAADAIEHLLTELAPLTPPTPGTSP